MSIFGDEMFNSRDLCVWNTPTSRRAPQVDWNLWRFQRKFYLNGKNPNLVNIGAGTII